VDRSTPGAALTHWLQQVVRGNYPAACLDMAGGSSSTASPAPYSAKTCAATSTSAARTLTRLHDNFSIDGITPQSSITVGTTQATGTSATVDGKDIQVSGSSLTALMIAHGTNVQSGQFAISFILSRLSGAWYVTNLNMNI
jgi:hypothetical protein